MRKTDPKRKLAHFLKQDFCRHPHATLPRFIGAVGSTEPARASRRRPDRRRGVRAGHDDERRPHDGVQERYEEDGPLQVHGPRRDDEEPKLIKRLLRNQPVEPGRIVTDGLGSYTYTSASCLRDRYVARNAATI